jgi:hypothetical protein
MDSSHRSNYPARRTLLFPSLDFFKFSFEQSVTSVSFESVIPDYVKESARLYKLYNILDPGKTTNKNKI